MSHTERTAPLYARLLKDELFKRSTGFADGITYVGFDEFRGRDAYLDFLRSQATSGPSSRGYCYFLALKEIG